MTVNGYLKTMYSATVGLSSAVAQQNIYRGTFDERYLGRWTMATGKLNGLD